MLFFCSRVADPWQLTVGVLQVDCDPVRKDGVDRLAVIRGLLTCCRTQILLSSHFCNSEVNIMKVCEENNFFFVSKILLFFSLFFKTSFLMDSLYPLVRALCEETLECHYFSFEG